jgi:hypothetical protein
LDKPDPKDKGDGVIKPPPPAPAMAGKPGPLETLMGGRQVFSPKDTTAANEAATEEMPAALQRATKADQEALRTAIDRLLAGQMTDADLREFQRREPEFLRAAMANGETVRELEKIYGTAGLNGLLEAAQRRPATTRHGRKAAPLPAAGGGRRI